MCPVAGSWHRSAVPLWSSQAALKSAVLNPGTALSTAGCQELMLSHQASVVHVFPVCSYNYAWQLLLLASISDVNFVRFGSIITPVQISYA